MLARELFRNDPERVRTMLAERHTEAPLDRLLEHVGMPVRKRSAVCTKPVVRTRPKS